MVLAIFVGEIRRLLAVYDEPIDKDPLLLIPPVIAVVLALKAWKERLIDPKMGIPQFLLVVMAVMFLQVFNPAQGPLVIGLSGLLFYLAPMQWFWSGQAWGGRRFVETLLLKVLTPAALIAAAMGVYQLVVGLLPHQQAWLDRLGGQLMIMVDGRVRAFSVFSSASEYSHFLALVIVGLVAWWLAGGRNWIVWAAPVLFVALVLIGSRGIVITLLFAITACWAVRSRLLLSWAPRLIAAFTLIAAAGFYGLSELNEADLPEQIQPLINRQAEGFGNMSESTASAHGELMWMGVEAALRNPIGYGLGSTTLAGLKFGGYRVTAEFDISNMFISLGLLGGVLYTILVLVIVTDALATWRASRETHTLVVFGMLLTELGAWLFSGHYATTAIVWLLVGVASAERRRLKNFRPAVPLSRAKASVRPQSRALPEPAAASVD